MKGIPEAYGIHRPWNCCSQRRSHSWSMPQVNRFYNNNIYSFLNTEWIIFSARSGFDGPWTTHPLRFDNEYYKVLKHLEYSECTNLFIQKELDSQKVDSQEVGWPQAIRRRGDWKAHDASLWPCSHPRPYLQTYRWGVSCYITFISFLILYKSSLW